MTALSSVYISMSSLLGFQRALSVISDNVANLNTVGFKASDLSFTPVPTRFGDLYDVGGRQALGGAGSTVESAGRRFTQGEIRETGSATHLAIDGIGFFVLSGPGGLLYTRSGQFELTEQGRLVDAQTGAALQSARDGRLEDLIVDLSARSPTTPTGRISFAGNLSSDSGAFQIPEILVVDADGRTRAYSLEFSKVADDASNAWIVSIRSGDGAAAQSGELRFDDTGAPIAGFNAINLPVRAASGQATTVVLDFGDPGSPDGATSSSGGEASTLAVSESDGVQEGRVTAFRFDSAGELTLTFSNGESDAAGQVALATFADAGLLQTTDGRLFVAPEGLLPELGAASSGSFGQLVPNNLELANIDLAREFADIIILQRGYQASSQVLNVSNQMIEDVYNSLSRGG